MKIFRWNVNDLEARQEVEIYSEFELQPNFM